MSYQLISNTTSKVQKYVEEEKGLCLWVDSVSLKKDNTYKALLMEVYPTNNYNRRLFEAASSLYATAANAFRLDRQFDSNLTEQGIDANIVSLARATANFVGYLTNTTSWRDQEMHEFDRQELKNRLQKIINSL